jgi:hypothetical protein
LPTKYPEQVALSAEVAATLARTTRASSSSIRARDASWARPRSPATADRSPSRDARSSFPPAVASGRSRRGRESRGS